MYMYIMYVYVMYRRLFRLPFTLICMNYLFADPGVASLMVIQSIPIPYFSLAEETNLFLWTNQVPYSFISCLQHQQYLLFTSAKPEPVLPCKQNYSKLPIQHLSSVTVNSVWIYNNTTKSTIELREITNWSQNRESGEREKRKRTNWCLLLWIFM